jgi:hypothetical protein
MTVDRDEVIGALKSVIGKRIELVVNGSSGWNGDLHRWFEQHHMMGTHRQGNDDVRDSADHLRTGPELGSHQFCFGGGCVEGAETSADGALMFRNDRWSEAVDVIHIGEFRVS